eukprot:scaffold492_cov257-Pinguiococcus_pyrenoidosus.AAC.23
MQALPLQQLPLCRHGILAASPRLLAPRSSIKRRSVRDQLDRPPQSVNSAGLPGVYNGRLQLLPDEEGLRARENETRSQGLVGAGRTIRCSRGRRRISGACGDFGLLDVFKSRCLLFPREKRCLDESALRSGVFHQQIQLSRPSTHGQLLSIRIRFVALHNFQGKRLRAFASFRLRFALSSDQRLPRIGRKHLAPFWSSGGGASAVAKAVTPSSIRKRKRAPEQHLTRHGRHRAETDLSVEYSALDHILERLDARGTKSSRAAQTMRGSSAENGELLQRHLVHL